MQCACTVEFDEESSIFGQKLLCISISEIMDALKQRYCIYILEKDCR